MLNDQLQAVSTGWRPEILTYDALRATCDQWRQEGLCIVFTNGCFDVLHSGHLELLREARSRGQRLIIGVNPDEWIVEHKGHGRPLQPAAIRCAVAHRMADADLSLIFCDATAERLLSIIRPTIYIIGSDYRDQQILGAEHCGEVAIMDRIPGVSTTAIIMQAKQATLRS
ncbi:MAG: adenylyltransferase/cytidyltransferase family protein [Planctomycetota bacterium]